MLFEGERYLEFLVASLANIVVQRHEGSSWLPAQNRTYPAFIVKLNVDAPLPNESSVGREDDQNSGDHHSSQPDEENPWRYANRACGESVQHTISLFAAHRPTDECACQHPDDESGADKSDRTTLDLLLGFIKQFFGGMCAFLGDTPG